MLWANLRYALVLIPDVSKKEWLPMEENPGPKKRKREIEVVDPE